MLWKSLCGAFSYLRKKLRILNVRISFAPLSLIAKLRHAGFNLFLAKKYVIYLSRPGHKVRNRKVSDTAVYIVEQMTVYPPKIGK